MRAYDVSRLTLRAPRSALTLLEVIISLAIFLFSVTAIAHLLSLSGDRALEANFRTQAMLRCQSKLAEVVAGAQPLSSSGWSSFSDNPGWNWQLSCSQGDIANLWNVQVSVKKKRADGSFVEVSLGQMVLDPAVRGSTLVDVGPSAPSGTASAGSSAKATGKTSSSASGASSPKTSGAAAPTRTTPSTKTPGTTTPRGPGPKGPSPFPKGGKGGKGGKGP